MDSNQLLFFYHLLSPGHSVSTRCGWKGEWVTFFTGFKRTELLFLMTLKYYIPCLPRNIPW